MPDIAKSLHAKGMRMTPQRRRIVQALGRLEHATPDALAAEVAHDGGPDLSLSTIYRSLETLEELAVVSHSHIEHRAPTYHLAEHADHLHLVCLGCGKVIESDLGLADGFVGELARSHGFAADISHMAIHGWCDQCSSRP